MKQKIIEILKPYMGKYKEIACEEIADEILELFDKAIDDIYQEQREITDLLISVTPKEKR